MRASAPPTVPMPPLDLMGWAAERRHRPYDFTLLFRMRSLPLSTALEKGAESALHQFPTSASVIRGGRWVRSAEPAPVVHVRSPGSPQEAGEILASFVNGRLDPTKTLPVRQMVMAGTPSELPSWGIRFHHALTDGAGASMWIDHQWQVANEHCRPLFSYGAFLPPQLRSHASPIRRSPFAWRGPSHSLAYRRGRPSAVRQWRTIRLPAARLVSYARANGTFTYNDLLIGTILDALLAWNPRHAPRNGERLALWIPTDIRQVPQVGFGNGTSRLRVYARGFDQASAEDRFRIVRRQVETARRIGEWALPAGSPLFRLPAELQRISFWLFSRRPRIDMASAVFSNSTRFFLPESDLADLVDHVDVVGPLGVGHPLGMYALTLGADTFFTCVSDPALLDESEVGALLGEFQQRLSDLLR